MRVRALTFHSLVRQPLRNFPLQQGVRRPRIEDEPLEVKAHGVCEAIVIERLLHLLHLFLLSARCTAHLRKNCAGARAAVFSLSFFEKR